MHTNVLHDLVSININFKLFSVYYAYMQLIRTRTVDRRQAQSLSFSILQQIWICI
jgi:hypothetical protein